jgi:hypothetical protein
MTNPNYSEPVSKLLTLGDCREMSEWPDYLALGLGPEHVPDLIRMVEDEDLNRADSESLEVWAPAHAWRALGQLRAEAAIEPLLGILWHLDDGDDWIEEEVPQVLGMIGPAALPRLAEYLADRGNGVWPRLAAAQALVEIARRHPQAWGDCVAVLTRTLEGFRTHHPALNAFLISFLVDLKAVEAAPLMEQAFAARRVDISILGDWEDAQIQLGLLEERQTPAPHYVQLPKPLATERRQSPRAAPGQQGKGKRRTAHRQRDKRKAQRKQQKQARRNQRKRK